MQLVLYHSISIVVSSILSIVVLVIIIIIASRFVLL